MRKVSLSAFNNAFWPRSKRSMVAALCGVLLVISGASQKATAQTAHFSGSQTSLGIGLSQPRGIAVDVIGNLYVADWNDNAVKEIRSSDGATITLGSGFANPAGVAVDGNNNVFVADMGNSCIKEMLAVSGVIPPSPTIRTLWCGLILPDAVAIDSSGDVIFSDFYSSTVNEILAVNGSIPNTPTVVTLGSGFSVPEGVAVDGKGNIFVGDTSNHAVKEMLAVNGSVPAAPTILTLGTGFVGPTQVALDSRGDVFVADAGDGAVKEMIAVNGSIPANPTIVAIGNGFTEPTGVALDVQGNVFISDAANTRISKDALSQVDFGSQEVKVGNSTISVSFIFDTPGTLGSTNVVTQGATGLDFSNAGTGSCAANTAYSAGQSCTVNVSFTPLFPGSRNGAVQISDPNGNVMATAFLQGIGVGPQLSFSPGAQTTLGSSFNFSSSVAVDGGGNAYVVDVINNFGNVQEILAVNGRIPANPTVKTVLGGLDCPNGPALDAAGDVYFVDVCYHTVNEIQAVNGRIPASPTVRVLTSQFVSPDGIAVDSRGNVYVLDASNNTVNEIFAVNGSIPVSPTITTLASGFKELDGIAVDGNGNVYVSDDTSRELFEIHAVNGAIPASPLVTSLGSGFIIPRGIAVDVVGNVYVAEYFYSKVYKILAVNGSIPSSPTIQTLGSGFANANGVAVDANRNVFVADYGDGRVLRLDYSDPPSLSFVSTVIGSPSVDSPQTVTLENVGNADMVLPVPASGNNPSISTNFALDENAPSACPVIGSGFASVGVLAAGTSCVFPVSFAPTAAGSLSGSLALTDNNLNATGPVYATQYISLSGTGTSNTPTITWSAPLAITYGTLLSAAQLDATASLPGTFSYSPAAGTVLTAGAHTLNVTLTPTDTTDYTIATAFVQLAVNKATPVITWPTPAPIAYGTAVSLVQLDATANVPGTFAYTPAAGTILPVGTNKLNVVFTPNDTADYTSANASVTLVVNPPPSYTLTASPSSLSVNQGSQASSAISVNATGGFTGAVSLSVSGLPKNVTASISPNPATKTSAVTFTASNGASIGNSLLTVTGKSGSLVQTTTITLAVVHK